MYPLNLQECVSQWSQGDPQIWPPYKSVQPIHFWHQLTISQIWSKNNVFTSLDALLTSGNSFSVIKRWCVKKWIATKEVLKLSGVPVKQVQEDLVRDRGFKHRKQAQMAHCRILISSTLFLQDVRKAWTPPIINSMQAQCVCVCVCYPPLQ